MDEILKKKPSRLKFIIPAAVLLMITAAMVFILLTQEESKPDPASEKIIRQAAAEAYFSLTQLKKDPNSLTDEDFAKITNISIRDKELSDIKLLEKFTNLQYLELVGIHYPSNKIPKWMSLLAKLGIFNLEERFSIDLSPIENLTNLQNLDLVGTNVSDIKPLSNLTKLNNLDLAGTNVSDIKPLANLTKLKRLNLWRTKVSVEQIDELKKALTNATIELRKPY